MNSVSQEQHNVEIKKYIKYWESKPILRDIYKRFYQIIAQYLIQDPAGQIVEIGSGIGNLKTVIPDCICTDIFPNPWIDQVQNAYELSFHDSSISNLILFDVWHHLEFPGTALQEFHRVLIPGGRVIIFDPAISFLGFIVWGIFHHEPIKFFNKIAWRAPKNFLPKNTNYYAAIGNTARIFCSDSYKVLLSDWKQVEIKRISSISYVASGGYSFPQLYPDSFYPFMTTIDHLCSNLPLLFATRLLVVLEKKEYQFEYMHQKKSN